MHKITRPEELWDTATTATYLKVPVATLHDWSYRSVGPSFFKVGRYRRYDPADVERWLSAHRRSGGAA